MGKITTSERDLFGTTGGEQLAERLRDLARGDYVRVAPEKNAWVPRENVKPGGMVMCRWVKGSDGYHRPMPVGGRFVRLCPSVAAELGFRHLDRRVRYETIMRLWRADMIDMIQCSPKCFFLDLDSWFRHLARCAENPDMWSAGGDAIKEYRYKNGMQEEK